MKEENWVWMPHGGHFILGHMCRFRLNTYVGKYIVSTVACEKLNRRWMECEISEKSCEIAAKRIKSEAAQEKFRF